MTPPKSLQGSLDSLQVQEHEAEEQETHYYNDLETFDTEWAQGEELGEVTGPPTKDHWKVCSNSGVIAAVTGGAGRVADAVARACLPTLMLCTCKTILADMCFQTA
jgi:hypothetical protein